MKLIPLRNFFLYIAILVLLSFALSGCNIIGPQACIDDNFCSFDEKLTGDCFDCRPDFAIDEKSWNANYNTYDNSVDASVCVKNIAGEYSDRVQIGWALSSNNDYRGDYAEEYVNFDAPDVQGNFQINVGKGNIWQNSNIQFANAQPQVQCFYKRFENVARAPYYYVNFNINSDQKVVEKSYENNYGWVYVNGASESYPLYLIEKSIGNYAYVSSRYEAEKLSLYDNREIAIDIYGSYHANKELSSSARISVVPYGDAKKLLYTIMTDSDLFAGLNKVVLGNGQFVYILTQGNYGEAAYVWTSGSYLLVGEVNGNDLGNMDVINAYMNRYVSDLTKQDGPDYVNPSTFNLGDVRKVVVDGVNHNVSVVGGNLKEQLAIVSVDGISKNFAKGTSMVINGLNVTAIDVSVQDIPTLTATARLQFYGTGSVPVKLQADCLECDRTQPLVYATTNDGSAGGNIPAVVK